MISISVKMIDGSRYDYKEEKDVAEMQQRIWELNGMPDLLPIEQDKKTVMLNGKHIVSITLKGE